MDTLIDVLVSKIFILTIKRNGKHWWNKYIFGVNRNHFINSLWMRIAYLYLCIELTRVQFIYPFYHFFPWCYVTPTYVMLKGLSLICQKLSLNIRVQQKLLLKDRWIRLFVSFMEILCHTQTHVFGCVCSANKISIIVTNHLN